jgi:hypothetical protein
MAEGRRAVVDGRLDEIEKEMAEIKQGQGGMKRRLDWVTKSTKVVIEGAGRVDTFWEEKVVAGPNQYFEMKAALPEALTQDLAEHLGVEWPLDPTRGENDKQLHILMDRLKAPGVLVGVYSQDKWQENNNAWVRLKGTFSMTLAYGLESLEIQCALKRLHSPLRRASGLKVHGQDVVMVDAGGQPPKKILVYVERMELEKNKGKGKGKGKGTGKGKAQNGGEAEVVEAGQGKGEGKAKGKGKGKGKGGKAGRGAGKGE